MSASFQATFASLRAILEPHAKSLMVKEDKATSYSLHGHVGPATVKLWRGKLKSPTIPVAWVRVSKAYVSFHLMGVYGRPELMAGASEGLRARMQGKSCFNFKAPDALLFKELASVAKRSIAGMRKAGFITRGSKP